MPVSMQVIYPVSEGSSFDHAYYASKHMELVSEHMGAHIQNTVVTKGLAGGAPEAPAPFHAIATIVFADQSAMDAALAASAPVMADLPNFTNVRPQVLVGEVIG